MTVLEYVDLSGEAKYRYVSSKIPGDVFTVTCGENFPQIKHNISGMDFAFIPGGNYIKGLTDFEYATVTKLNDFKFEGIDLDELRPAHDVWINDFLITDYPVSRESLSVIYPEYKGRSGAAWLPKEDADKICKDLGMRLPTDDEWEYMSRGGSKKRLIFPFGPVLISDDSEMEKWLILDYDKSKMNCNNLGIYGLFHGEWTGSHYTDSYSEEDMNNPREAFCIRGGGSLFWPWQDCGEWLHCICANRMSSDGLFEDRSAAFRLVYEL